MSITPVKSLTLDILAGGMPGVSKRIGASFGEACTVAFCIGGHSSGVTLRVKGTYDTEFVVVWNEDVTEQIRRSYKDLAELAEKAATGVAFLLIRALTPHVILERAAKGTGVDYFLCMRDNTKSDDELFSRSARLEVSGILKGTVSSINTRVKQKLNQTQPTDGTLPAFIIVVEFSRPLAQVVEK